MSARVRIVGASAGTGKTHRLTEVVVDAVSRAQDPVRPAGVVAITYTRRAAAELSGRIRRSLMARGAWAAASRCRDGYIGTIHAVCDRLLREFPLEAGLPPDLVLLDDMGRARLVGEALERAIHEAPGLDALARRGGLRAWTDQARDLVQKARANGMSPDRLRACGLASVAEVRELLGGEPVDDPQYPRDLWNALNTARAAIETWHKAGAKRIESIEKMRKALRNGEIPPWCDQVALAAELSGQRQYDAVSVPLATVVDRHARNALFHRDVVELCDTLFRVAARAADEYEALKKQHRVLDYDDMLAEALRLLDHAAVREELASRLDLVVVDEFQDTSPLQLAILLKLSEIVPASTWVGDPKQAIYGFQGTDPELMITAMQALSPSGATDVLRISRRSRPALVRLATEVFTRALAPHGHLPEHVAVDAHRVDPAELIDEPALELWTFRAPREGWDRKSGRSEGFAIADGVAALLRDGFKVVDADGSVRAGRAGDIAVLMRRNIDCVYVADSLRLHAIPARVHLAALHETAEARVVRAGLGILADPRAVVPAMDLAWLSSPEDPDAWLATALQSPTPFAEDARVQAVRAIDAMHLSPIEAFDRVVQATGVIDRCAGWPDPGRRIANVEAMRAEVRAYQDECGVDRRACTLPGLVAHLEDMERRARRRFPRDVRAEASANQAMPTDPDAVTVLTWHAAKGLEWRVVVLGTLGQTLKSTPFEVDVEPAEPFDPLQPLAGRRVRWWPNPYGQRDESAYAQRARLTAPARRRARRDAEERARLLYVGFTRPRDRLILALDTTDGVAADAWLRELRDGDDQPVLGLPAAALDETCRDDTADLRVGADLTFSCRIRRVRAVRNKRTAEAPARAERLAFDPPASPRRAEIVLPSSVELAADVAVSVGPAVAMTGRIRLPEAVERMDNVGNAIHGFLAADVPDPAERLDRAERAIAAHDVTAVVQAVDLLRCGDALTGWVADRFGPVEWLREWPVRWALPDGRLMIGEIDLLLDLGDALVIIDHKSFPGSPEERDRRAASHAGQLAAYAAVAAAALGKPVQKLFIHFPVRGEMQEVVLPDGAFAAWLGTPLPEVVRAPIPAVAPAPTKAPAATTKAPPAKRRRGKLYEEPSLDQLDLFPPRG